MRNKKLTCDVWLQQGKGLGSHILVGFYVQSLILSVLIEHLGNTVYTQYTHKCQKTHTCVYSLYIYYRERELERETERAGDGERKREGEKEGGRYNQVIYIIMEQQKQFMALKTIHVLTF